MKPMIFEQFLEKVRGILKEEARMHVKKEIDNLINDWSYNRERKNFYCDSSRILLNKIDRCVDDWVDQIDSFESIYDLELRVRELEMKK